MQQRQPFTQFDVDAKCRVLTSDQGILTKTFGSGIAFPIRTNDGMVIADKNKPNPRADSYSLYLNFVAKTILDNMLPKSKMYSKLQKTTRNSKGTVAIKQGDSSATQVRTIINKDGFGEPPPIPKNVYVDPTNLTMNYLTATKASTGQGKEMEVEPVQSKVQKW